MQPAVGVSLMRMPRSMSAMSGFKPSPGVARRLLGTGLLVLIAACSKPMPPTQPPRPVVAIGAQGSAATSGALRTPGEIAARYSTPLSFRVAGKLSERKLRLGDTVEAGQLVATLDPSDLGKTLASAEAQRQAAESRLGFARQQLDREQRLIATNVISRAQLDQTRDAATLALAQRDSAAQQAALAKDQLGYASLKAEHAGVITGELADTGQNVAAGQPIYQLAWSGDIDVICDVPESALAGIAVGSKAEVRLAALPQRRFEASVRELAPAADPASRTYRARLSMHGDANTLDGVRLGMSAEVSFAPTDGSAVGTVFVLPTTALFHDAGKPALWIVNADELLELRPVVVSGYGERTVSVASGIREGERVVVQGVHSVHAGTKVRTIAPLHADTTP